MNFREQLFRKITSIAFVLALLMPTMVQFAHALEGHEHKVCNNFSTHIHKTKLNCAVCDFHFSTFNYSPENLFAFNKIETFQKTEIEYFFTETTSSSFHYLLRGPPLFS